MVSADITPPAAAASPAGAASAAAGAAGAAAAGAGAAAGAAGAAAAGAAGAGAAAPAGAAGTISAGACCALAMDIGAKVAVVSMAVDRTRLPASARSCRVILTSWISGYEEPTEPVDAVILKPFSPVTIGGCQAHPQMSANSLKST
ncbi:MAG: hypothetical protein EOP71_06920 [Variovorax sp.]|nr:MAG: hypothetical protein EOP71_06920 [Variovorax sp.]